VRFVVLSALAASVLVSLGLVALWREGRSGRALMALFAVIMVVEYLPRPIPLSSPEMPGFVGFLRSRPGPGAVVDLVTPRWEALYYQTVHGRPIMGGHVARLPRSVLQKDQLVRDLVERRQYGELSRRYGFKYLVLRRTDPGPAAGRIYEDPEVSVYDLAVAP